VLLLVLGRFVLPEGAGWVPDCPAGAQPGLSSAPHSTGYSDVLAKFAEVLAHPFGKAVLLD